MSGSWIQVPAGLTTEGLLDRRCLALLIDEALAALFVTVAAGLAGTGPPEDSGGSASGLFGAFLFLILWIGYGTALESSAWHATLGKRWMRLRVYDAQGGRLTPLQAAGRNLTKCGPFFVFQFVPDGNFMSMIWLGAQVVALHHSPVYQAIHDRIAHTWLAAPERTTQLRLT
jgi:uncharacterized RDD family membrane protein YckC